MEPWEPWLDECYKTFCFLRYVVCALHDAVKEFARHRNAPCVHILQNKLDDVADADRALQTCSLLKNRFIPPFQIINAAVDMTELIKSSAYEAIKLLKQILTYEDMFVTARNAPKDMQRIWKFQMSYMSNMETKMRRLVSSCVLIATK